MGEGLDTGILDQATPEPAEKLDKDGAGHDNNGWEAQTDDRVVIGGESFEALEGDLKERSYHYDGEDEHTDRFEPSSANGV